MNQTVRDPLRKHSVLVRAMYVAAMNGALASILTAKHCFCYIERSDQTTFGCRLSLTQARMHQLVETLEVSPQVLSLMLGEPDYWAPGDFASLIQKSVPEKLGKCCKLMLLCGKLTVGGPEFFCQHPRWHIHTKDVPLSVYMTHNLADRTTSYIVMTDKTHSRLGDIRRRICASFASGGLPDTKDPFMVHCLVLHEIFLDAKSVITPLRGSLYDQLDLVDIYSSKPLHERGRAELEDMTIEMHVISQEIDSVTAGAEMTAMIVRRMQIAHDRYCTLLGSNPIEGGTTKISDTLRYLLESAESQKRWLVSYKSRKDIALNLVSLLFHQSKDTIYNVLGLQPRHTLRRHNQHDHRTRS